MATIDRDTVCEPLWAVLKDIPTCGNRSLWKRLKSSYQGIESRVRTRGVGLLLDHFPAAGKHLDKALSRGFINFNLLPDELTFKGEPVFFAELYELIFDLEDENPYGNHAIRWNVDPTWVFYLRTLLYMYKKLEVACPPERVGHTVLDFYRMDLDLRKPSLHWNNEDIYYAASLQLLSRITFLDGTNASTHTSYDCSALNILQNVADIVSSKFPVLNPEDVKPKHGPNAVADLRGGMDKFSFPHWPRKLQWVFPMEYFAYSTEEWARSDQQPRVERNDVAGKLIAVPKTHKSPRLITVEPTSHQYLQQGLLRWLRKNLPWPLQHCIDFQNQLPSRDAAKDASFGLNGMATVDLSSASDRLSCWTVERAFRKSQSLLTALYATRTYVVEDHTKSGVFPAPLYLRKFAGQGSAVTFPVQSIIYAICCIAAVIDSRGDKVSERSILRAAKQVRVFGDDIVIPTTALLSLSLIFEHLQLKINMGKTHFSGLFRESCGGDFFRGIDVTPLYLRTLDEGPRPSVVSSLVDVSNNAYEKGLWHTSEYLRNLVSKDLQDLIPVSDTPQSCLTWRTFQRGLSARYTSHSCDLQCPTVKGLHVHSKERTVRREGHRDLLAYFLEVGEHKPYTDHPWSAGYRVAGPQILRTKWAPIIER